MTQIVFLHGPGAGGCADAFFHQTRHFPDSLAPTLPGHFEGTLCKDVEHYMEWVRGWLWAQGKHRDLVLVGYTLGAAIALQYGLDYPDEVKGLVLMSVSIRPKALPKPGSLELRLRAQHDPVAYEEWLEYQRHNLQFVDAGLRERLMERHRQLGPLIQYHDMKAIFAFDIRDRIASLKPKLLLLRGMKDPTNPPEYEKEIHEAVPGSRYVKLADAGHFPAPERPDEINTLIEEFAGSL